MNGYFLKTRSLKSSFIIRTKYFLLMAMKHIETFGFYRGITTILRFLSHALMKKDLSGEHGSTSSHQ